VHERLKPEHVSQWRQQALVLVCMLKANVDQENLLVDIHIQTALYGADVVLFPHKHQIINSFEAVDHVSIKCFSAVKKMSTKMLRSHSACIS